MTDRICSQPDCEKPHVARGLCGAHYQLWRKHGVAERVVRPVHTNPVCAVETCDHPRTHRAWCRNHYQRWARHGDPTGGYRSPGAPLPPCSVEGCVQPTPRIIKGMCEMHYTRVIETGVVGPAAALRIVGDDEARFWSNVDMLGPLPPHRLTLGWCWQWTRPLNGDGYGSFSVGSRSVGPHRWAYDHFIGTIPDGYEVDHLCHNRACVNFLRHLEAVPKGENLNRKLVIAPEYGWAAGL
ncbi:HNH endonuclease signature motif containing protein [Nocardioides sp. PD653]|uniref:HNH endonuclease signature motif containing protein n=1 Tax=Nocardioides sp. PD653 TaxID=393303 RepID=UPI0009EFA643|nr:HNH endonuclease signature motif containing protein [Nocardioides sp. PD653]GAW54731.1 hypothetical protein PD653_2145 [Nocardioides sp. PD653]